MNRLKVLFLLLALTLVFACKSAPEAANEPVQKEEAQTVEETVVEPTEKSDEKAEPVEETAAAPAPANDGSGYIVYFAPESYSIDSFTASKLDMIAEQLRAEKAKHLVVVGHSAKLNTEKAENRISLQRAEAVAEYFQSLDIFDADAIEIEGKGAEVPAGSHAEITERPNNRRVEIKYAQ